MREWTRAVTVPTTPSVELCQYRSMRPKAVLLDIGGVFVVPHCEPVSEALAEIGIDAKHRDFVEAHYAGIMAVDRGSGVGWDMERYLRGYVEALGVQPIDVARVLDALVVLWSAPAKDLWRFVLDDSVQGLRELSTSGLPIGFVSNADGTAAQLLEDQGIAQVGEGPGTDVAVIVDSTVVGVSKPDPKVFDSAIAAVGVAPDDAVYVGDSVRYDVLGAEAARLVAIHFDPYGRCEGSHEHRHIRSIGEILG
jgi:putative hydrolase of the HAD superfamily